MDLVKNIGAVATSVMAVAALLGGIWWLVRRIVKITDAVQQLKPNGGSSMADKMNALTTKVAELQTGQDTLKSGQDNLTNSVEKLSTDVEGLKLFDDEIREALIPKQRRKR